jgi:TRAP transporter 4TM/12TM fusion protein
MRGIGNTIIKVVGIAMALFHCYTAYAGTYHPLVQRSVHATFGLVLAFLCFRASKTSSRNGIPLYDWLLALLTIPVFGYITLNWQYLTERFPMTPLYPLSPLEMLFAILAILLLFEATRRLIGLPLVIVASVMLAYCYLGPYIPLSVFRHRGFTIMEILDFMFLTDQGIWGVAAGVSATYLAIFVIFGAFMGKGGAGEFFIEFATSLTGHTRGGAAKVAIFSSALVGSVTGASMANVYTTGTFTIPMMKRLGYKPAFAGAVEALASNGGQIMPPVMGATAFLMAAFIGTSYAKVILAAITSAFIYFGALFVYIHFEAIKLGLEGMPREEKPPVKDVLLKGGHQLIPLAVLIFLLFYGFSALRAGFFAILLSIPLSWIRKETRMGIREIADALEEGAKNTVMMVATCVTIGLVVGSFLLTGLGLTFSSAIISLSGGIFFISLLFTGMACLVMGMGMNSPAVYILVSVIATPILITQEVQVFPAHLFVFFCAILSHITPPVCLAIFAAAQLAGSSIWDTAATAMRTGFVAYLLPFLVIYNPGITLRGTPAEMVIAIISVSLGTLLLVCAVHGRALYTETRLERVLSALGGIFLIWPSLLMKIAGTSFVVLILALQILRNKKLNMSSLT